MKTKPKPKAEKPPEKPSKTFERIAKMARQSQKRCAADGLFDAAYYWQTKADTYLGAASIARSYGA